MSVIKTSKDDSPFSGRGFPALMSPKEPAIKLLRQRYSESFALTSGKERQVHLFMIKVGLWSLVYTFTPRDVSSDSIDIGAVLSLIEKSITSESQFVLKLDNSVERARDRIKNKVDAFPTRLPLR